MIKISVKPRQDNLFDIYVGDEGDHFLNSDQGYENVEDAEAIVHRLWPPLPTAEQLLSDAFGGVDSYGIARKAIAAISQIMRPEPVVLVVTYRNGKTKTEQLR